MEKAIILPFSSNTYPPENFNKIDLWRVRTKVAQHEDIGATATFSYPSKCYCNGRANLQTQPVFYGSLAASTALFEVKSEKGDIIYLSHWKGNANRDFTMQMLFPDNLPANNPFYLLQQEQKRQIAHFSNLYGRDKGKHLEFLVHFLGTKFVKDMAPYLMTSWLGHDILFGANPVDMLIYPSVTALLNACNIAIRPEFSDECLYADFVYQLQVHNLTYPHVHVDIQAVAKNVDGLLIWSEPDADNTQLFYKSFDTAKYILT